MIKLQEFREQITARVGDNGALSSLHPSNWDKQLEKIPSGSKLFYITHEDTHPYNLVIKSVIVVRGANEWFVDLHVEEPKKPRPSFINHSVAIMFIIFLLGLIAGGIMGVNIQLQDLRDMYKKTHITPESNR